MLVRRIRRAALYRTIAFRGPLGWLVPLLALSVQAQPVRACVGDCNGMQQVTIDELVRGVNIALGNAPASQCPAFDRDGSGGVTIDELIAGVNNALNGCPPETPATRTPTPIPTPTRPTPSSGSVSLVDSSPAKGEGGVAITRETILRFNGALSPASVTLQAISAWFGDDRFGDTIHLSDDGTTVTLFYSQPYLPASARIRVTVDGDRLRDTAGRPVDGDGDGSPGGSGTIEFDTLTITTISGTIVCGRVFASELATMSGGQTVNRPLAGVTVTVDGVEQTMNAVTDEFGDFRLDPAPAGRFFVHIDGRSATAPIPQGAYYPVVGKAWESRAGEETNIGEVYLPLITAGTLQPVSETEDTTITLPAAILEQHPELNGVQITVPAGSLFSEAGLDGGMVGIAPVPPDRIPGASPSGLEFPIVITVQSDFGTNFDTPVPICFPNLPQSDSGQPLAPGTKTGLWSFNHDAGRWELRGSMTVSADGRTVCSDPGVGIEAPGWHGFDPDSPGDSTPQPSGSPTPEPSPEPAPSQPPDDDGEDGDPVYLFSGEFYANAEDLRIKGRGFDFVWSRKYRSRIGPNTAQGNAWDFSYNLLMEKKGADLMVCDGKSRRDLFKLGGGLRDAVAARGRSAADGSAAAVAVAGLGWQRREFFRQIDCRCSGPSCLNLCGGDGATQPDPNPSPAPDLRMTFEDGRVWEYHPFNGNPEQGKIRRSADRTGNEMRFEYDAQGRLMRIIDTLDRPITIAYNGDGFIASVTDFSGRQVAYTYYGRIEAGGSFGDLKTVTTVAVTGTPNGNDFPNGKTWTYTYSKGFADERLNHNLLTVTDPKGQVYLRNTYAATTDPADPNFDRVVRQIWGNPSDGIDFTYIPQVPSAGNAQATMKTILRDRAGNVREYFFNGRNLLVRKLEYSGRADPTQATTETLNRPKNRLRATDPQFFETRYEYNDESLRTRVIHPNGNITEYVYEADLDPAAPARSRANLRIMRRLPGIHTPAGDQAKIEESYEYDPRFGGAEFITKHTDARGNLTTHTYDAEGNRMRTQHRIASIVEDWEYNAFGQTSAHVLPDNGSGHRRRDEMTYHASGPQRGYLQASIIDAANLRLTTTHEYNAVGVLIRIIDPRGHDSQLIVNQRDQLVRVSSREVTDGSGIRYQIDRFFDANDNLVRTDVQNVDETGTVQPNTHFTTTIAHEILDQPTRVSREVDGSHSIVTEVVYDANRNPTRLLSGEAVNGNQPASEIRIAYDERDLALHAARAPGDAAQSSTEMDYDRNRNVVAIRRGLEGGPRVRSRVYDGYDRVVSITDPMGNLSEQGYDPNGNAVSTRVNGEILDAPGAAGNVGLSSVTSIFDPMDRVTEARLAFFDTATQTAVGDGQSVMRFAYSDGSHRVRVENDNGHVETTRYDTADRRSVITDAKGNTTTYAYDANSNLLSRTAVEKSDLGSRDQSFASRYAYDNLDRPIEEVDNVGNTHRFAFDSRNNVTRFVDAKGNAIRYVHDGLGRLSEMIQELTDTGDGTGAPAGMIRTRSAYDDNSRLISQTDDNARVTAHAYDPLNRRITTTLADGTARTVSYDVHGNPISTRDANGTVVTTAYDLLDRRIRDEVVPGPGVSDETTVSTFAYDGLSRLVRAQDDDSLVTRHYDSLSNVIREVLNGEATASAFDGMGNILAMTYPGGRQISSTYDELERKKTITDGAAGLVASYDYFGPQRIERRQYGNGTRTVFGYDDARRVIRTTHSTGTGALVDDRSATWDPMYRKSARTDLRTGLAETLRYDSINRLVQSVRTPQTGVPQTTAYAFDGAQNRTAVTGGPDAGAYTRDASQPAPADAQVNQYSGTPFDARVYDENGNLSRLEAAGDVAQVAYNDADLMVSHTKGGTSTTYRYDALGRRIARVVDGAITRYFYDGWKVCEEQDGAGATEATYVHGLGMDDIVQMRRDQDYFYHEDELGSVTSLTRTGGAVAERYAYGDYGSPSFFDVGGTPLAGSAAGNPYLFTGRELDPETGWYNYRTRYLDPRSGRFTSRDSIGVWGDAGNLGNGYAYVGNDPVSAGDPTGRIAPLVPAVAGAAALILWWEYDTPYSPTSSGPGDRTFYYGGKTYTLPGQAVALARNNRELAELQRIFVEYDRIFNDSTLKGKECGRTSEEIAGALSKLNLRYFDVYRESLADGTSGGHFWAVLARNDTNEMVAVLDPIPIKQGGGQGNLAERGSNPWVWSYKDHNNTIQSKFWGSRHIFTGADVVSKEAKDAAHQAIRKRFQEAGPEGRRDPSFRPDWWREERGTFTVKPPTGMTTK